MLLILRDLCTEGAPETCVPNLKQPKFVNNSVLKNLSKLLLLRWSTMPLYLSPQFKNVIIIYSFAPLRTLLFVLKAYRRIGAWSFIIWKFSGHPTTSILTGMYTGSIPSIWEKACHAKLCNNVMSFKNALQRPPLSSCKIDAAWCKLCRLRSLGRAKKNLREFELQFHGLDWDAT